jgi:Flp pilus assembly pilin Flp
VPAAALLALGAVGARIAQRGAARAQGVVEYGLILSLTVLFTVLILGVFGGTVSDVLSAIANAIDASTGS